MQLNLTVEQLFRDHPIMVPCHAFDNFSAKFNAGAAQLVHRVLVAHANARIAFLKLADGQKLFPPESVRRQRVDDSRHWMHPDLIWCCQRNSQPKLTSGVETFIADTLSPLEFAPDYGRKRNGGYRRPAAWRRVAWLFGYDMISKRKPYLIKMFRMTG